MKNKVQDLRNILFAQLEKLADDELFKDSVTQEKEIKRTTAMVDLANSIIDSARAETEFLKATSDNPTLLDSPFFQILDSEKKLVQRNNK